MAGVRALRKIQIGKESTRGTAVAATARLIGDVTYRDASEKVTPERDYGLLARAAELGQIVRQLTEVELDTELSYEQILYPLLAGLKGAVTPTATVWTFTPSQTADPAPDAFTFEYVENDGTANVQTLRSTFNLCKTLRISASQAVELAMMRASFFGRGATVQTPTASIGIPTRTTVPAPKFLVKLEASMANLVSGTAIDALVLASEWELDTGIAPKFRLDNDSPDFATYQFGRRTATLRLTLDLSATSEVERASIFRAASKRFARMAVTNGSDIITIDGCYELLGPVESGAADEGQSTVTLEYKSFYDSVSGKDIEVVVDNTLSALP